MNTKTSPIKSLVAGETFHFPGNETLYKVESVFTMDNMTRVVYTLVGAPWIKANVFTKVSLTSIYK